MFAGVRICPFRRNHHRTATCLYITLYRSSDHLDLTGWTIQGGTWRSVPLILVYSGYQTDARGIQPLDMILTGSTCVHEHVFTHLARFICGWPPDCVCDSTVPSLLSECPDVLLHWSRVVDRCEVVCASWCTSPRQPPFCEDRVRDGAYGVDLPRFQRTQAFKCFHILLHVLALVPEAAQVTMRPHR